MDFHLIFIPQHQMVNRIIALFVFLGCLQLHAQDSSSVLTYNDYIAQVMIHHPSAFRAELIGEYGDANLLAKKGYTDPKIFADINQKYFSGSQYYSYFSSGIKVPTWYGVSVEAGYSLNDGDYLNNENRLPESGLVYAGVKLDIGNGLIWNERRYAIESGRIVQQSSQIEREVYLNELRYKATEAYIKWFASYQKMLVYQDAVENAEIRLISVKESAIFGDRPFIDTTEAFITLANRQLSLETANRDFKNAEAYLETFLWTNGTVPIELEGLYPNTPTENEIYLGEKALQDQSISNHLFIQIQQFKLAQNSIELKLQREQLKPDLSLKYNLLSEPIGNNPFAQYDPTNYQWGVSFNYAFISRKQRGNVKLAEIKLEDQQLALKLKEKELSYKIEAAETNYTTAIRQAELTQKIVQSNLTLYQSERTMFEIGESSVFMINTRETNYLNAQKETIEAQSIQLQSLNELRYVMQF